MAIDGETMETVIGFIFLSCKITANGVCSHEIKRCLLLGRKAMTNLDSILKSRDITLPTKFCLVKTMVFPVVIYGCENWTIKLTAEELMLKNWTVVLEKTLESPLDCKEIQPVHHKGNQSFIFIWWTDADAEAPILWSPDVKNCLDAGNYWGQKKMTEDEMVGWHHWLKGHEFEQAPWVADGWGSLVCYLPWGHKESDMTERLNWSHTQKSTNSDPDDFNFPQIFTGCQLCARHYSELWRFNS